jgi:outer membrane protein assembly factor BamB
MPRRRRRRRSRWLQILPWVMLPLFAVLLTALEFHLRGGLPAKPKPKAGPELVWIYQPVWPGAIVSSPLVDVGDNRVYVGVIRDKGLRPEGVVVALQESTGYPIWAFDDDRAMIHMYSSPRVADGRLYIGEGMHANLDCKLRCLEAATGRALWQFGASGHIESTPCIADGRVYFGAGDDGIYALDAATGERLWQFDEAMHVDGSPIAEGGKVYVATAVSRRFKTTRLLCLDAVTGKPDWQLPTELPSWSAPLLDGGQLFVTFGNGRLDRSDPAPAGEVICVEASSHKRFWSRPLPDGVMGSAAADAERVYIGCRDGHVYALKRTDGSVVWTYDAGSPVVTTPALLEGRLYVTASGGRVACLDAVSGGEIADFDIGAHAGADVRPRLWSSPTVRRDDTRHRVYFGVELRYPDQHADAALYCVRF